MKVRRESVQTRSETDTRRREALRHTRAVCRRAERQDCPSQLRIQACSRSFMNIAGLSRSFPLPPPGFLWYGHHIVQPVEDHAHAAEEARISNGPYVGNSAAAPLGHLVSNSRGGRRQYYCPVRRLLP